jgi:hypothetical protein
VKASFLSVIGEVKSVSYDLDLMHAFSDMDSHHIESGFGVRQVMTFHVGESYLG